MYLRFNIPHLIPAGVRRVLYLDGDVLCTGPGLSRFFALDVKSKPVAAVRENVRVRLGQAAFRQHLLSSNGPVCIFTGDCPASTLEAAHLYSYAKIGRHHEHGGFLMCRDLHRLFDLGLLAVNPTSLTVDVSPTLARYPAYSALRGQPLQAAVRGVEVQWMRKHWQEHRSPNSAG